MVSEWNRPPPRQYDQSRVGMGRRDVPFGGASGPRGQGYREREPVMMDDPVETPMAKPAPVASDQKPVAAPLKPGQALGGGSHAAGIRVDATASPAAALSGGAMSPASHVNTGASTAVAQVNNAQNTGRPNRGPVGPLPGQPGNPYTDRIASGQLPQDPRFIAQANSDIQRLRSNRAPIMSDYAPPPAPTGRRGARRPFP